MCLTAASATLAKTILLAHEAKYQEQLVHLLGYQNMASSHVGPNAMILPVPSAVPLGAEHLIDTTEFTSILDDAAKAVTPQTRSLPMSRGPGLDTLGGGVTVHRVGIYHIVSIAPGASPEAIRAAIDEKVPPRKRLPGVERYIGGVMAKYPAWPVVACCFDNAAAQKSQPILAVYPPLDPTRLWAPALDDHTGNGPDLDGEVKRDHVVAFGSYRMEPNTGSMVSYDDEANGSIPKDVLDLLPRSVVGGPVNGFGQNGDFAVDVELVRTGKYLDEIPVVPPPGA